ncbi:hypothetical protein JRQ81_017580 [Phrynocephalus forsythii]|uniref:Uncharacterized protein n=1 Tax=Phrynocephalus forsythii TaxID=171643 RepID=A0A9Q0XT29_9SAUR|nr:hypothetical protein JRQ81_017580 [Phrynocephalus forsythii]
MLTYGAELWGLNKATILEQNQTSFLRSILGTDKNTSAPAVRAELGMHSLQSNLIIKVFNYWLKILFMDTNSLPKICLMEQTNMALTNSWISRLHETITHHGFSIQYLLSIAPQARDIFKQRVLDISAQSDLELLSKNRSLSWLAKNKITFLPEKYISMPLPQVLRRAFTRARFELLDSMVKYGRFHHLPYQERTCICGSPSVENISHILFDCQLYAPIRLEYLSPFLERTVHRDPIHRLSYLLSGSNVYIVRKVAKFVTKAAALRTQYVEQIGVSCKGDLHI